MSSDDAATPRSLGRRGTRADRDWVPLAVVAIAAVALLARLVALGDRAFHWDEARVGYWTLRYLASGVFEYRPVAGGPFLYVVDRHVFGLLGASDFSARLVVAVVSGLSPLVALAYRTRLDDLETALFAGLLAVTPLLLYYGRFLRGDVLLVVFALAAVGCAIRAWDASDRRFVYAATAFAALALTTSGFVVATVACVVAAAGLVVDHRRILGRGPPDGDALRDRLDGESATAARALLLAVAVVVFFFAPRAGDAGGPGLWKPTTFPAVLEAVFVEAPRAFVGVRVLNRSDGGTHELLPYLADLGGAVVAGGVGVLALAVFAFLRDRYSRGEPRTVVAVATYWGLLSLPVFAVVTEVSAPWVGAHVLGPLTLPAGVGLAAVARFGARVADADGRSVAAVLLLVLALVGNVGVVTAGSVYGPPTPDDRLVHYAQPADDVDELARSVAVAIEGNDGVDVLYVGDPYDDVAPRDTRQPPVEEAWGERLPLPWYFERAGATTDSVRSSAQLDRFERTPPVVVADASREAELAASLSGYEARTYRLALWNRDVVVFLRR